MRLIAVGVCVLLLRLPCFAWGASGHRIVARIAARNLSPAAKAKVAAIFGTNAAGVEQAMAAASTWPDEINKKNTKTGNWHFIDVPVAAPFSVGTLCAKHECVIDRIQEMANRLGMNENGFKLAQPASPSRPMTSQELAFLIHFVGDIHQPLHTANDGDRGGNCDVLTTPIVHGPQDTTQLHAVWDVDEVLAVMKIIGGEDKTVTALFQMSQTGTPVQQLTLTDWAREANDLAKKDVYLKLDIPSRTAPVGQCALGIAKVTVTAQYVNGNVPDVERQLLSAGIRLSNLLNQICSGTGCKAQP